MNTRLACECGRSIHLVAPDDLATSGSIIAGAEVMGWRPDAAKVGSFRCRECAHAATKVVTSSAPPASFDELEDALANLVTAALRLGEADAGSLSEPAAELTRARERVRDVVTAREQQTAGEVAAELAEVMAGRARAHKANAEFLLARSQPKTRRRA